MAMREVHKRYLREVFIAMTAYAVLIVVFGVLMPKTESTFWRIVLAVLPLVPVLFLIRALVRVIRDQDELERRIDLEAMAIASMTTGFGFFSLGLLLRAKAGWTMPADSIAIWVLPCLFMTFGIAKLWVVRRYRHHE